MSTTLVALLESIIFIVILVGGFFVGFWRGIKKSVANMIISLIGAVVAFFVTPVVTRAILSISITVDGTQTTIQNAIVTALQNNQDIGQMMQNNPNMEVFFKNLPLALGNVVVFIALTIAVECVVYLIYKIISIFLKTEKGAKKHRLAGGLVGLAKTFAITVFSFMPFACLIGVFDQMTTPEAYYSQTSQVSTTANEYGVIGEKLPKEVVISIKGLNEGMLSKICSFTNLDDSLFDYYSTFTIDGAKVTVRKELLSYYKAVDFAYQTTSLEKVNFQDINFTLLDKAVDGLEKSPVFENVLAKTLADVIHNHDQYSFIKDNETINDYMEILNRIDSTLSAFTTNQEIASYFTHDIDKLYSAFKSLSQSGVLDAVIDLQEKNVENIIDTISNTRYYNGVVDAIKKVLDCEIVRNSLDIVLTKNADDFGSDIDAVSVDTTNWNNQDWEELKTSLTDTVTYLTNINLDIIKDYSYILDENNEVDVDAELSNIGKLVYNIISNKLLVNSENKSIFEKLLDKNNLTLPADAVKDSQGNEKQIDSYTKLFEFIAPSIKKIRINSLYSLLSGDDEVNQKIVSLAGVLSQEGNSNLANEIVMPLYQIKFVKELIDKNVDNLNSSLMNLSVLSNYDEWDSDLRYLSSLLVSLNKASVTVVGKEQSYLSLVLNDDTDTVLKNINDNQIDEILKPLFYAKSTSSLKTNILNKIKDVLSDATGSEVTLTLDGATLKENNADDQTNEICLVMKKFVAINKNYSDGQVIEEINKQDLGALLDAMKLNAYRTENDQTKTSEGIFKDSLNQVVSTLKTTYQDAISYLDDEEVKTNLNNSNYKDIDFASLLSKIEEYENSKTE